MYYAIFLTNVMRILRNRNMTKLELAKRSGVSISFLSDLTTGKANPSLKIMEAIAVGLSVPLPILLESPNQDPVTSKEKISGTIPTGYERVYEVLPEYRAFQVKKWGEETKRMLQKVNSLSL